MANTTIYMVPDITTGNTYYFVPDANTQSQGQSVIPSAIWTVGDSTAANAQLSTSQQNFINSNTYSQHFSQMKSMGTDPNGNNIWTACNIQSEEPNTTVLYDLFCDVQSGFIAATGTDAANTVLQSQQQAVLTWGGLSSIITLDAMPTPKKRVTANSSSTSSNTATSSTS